MHPYKIAIDIGGTEIKAAVVDQSLNFIEYIKTPTPNNIDTFIEDKIYNIVMTFQKSYQMSPLYVGISSAGVIDEHRGIVEYAGPTIPNYVGTDFKCLLKPLYAQVNVFNDVNAALLGELVFHDYSAQNIFCLTLGTGIGGAFYNKYSQLYNGERNRANEIGYLLFDRQTKHSNNVPQQLP